MKTITWKPTTVLVSKMKPGPNQFKIKTEIGKERLRESMKRFGNAGALVLNKDLTIIDGHSRYEEAKRNKVISVVALVPDRQLTPKEYTEMNAIYDYASAGGIDMDRIKTDLGSAEDFAKQFMLDVPPATLEALGNGAKNVSVNKAGEKEVVKSDTRMVTIVLNTQQEEAFRAWEVVCAERFHTDNVTDTVMEALKFVAGIQPSKPSKMDSQANGIVKTKKAR